MDVTSSPADRAFEIFRDLVGKRKLFRADDPKLTESDTRAKLIDPVFRAVLGWSEAEIRREEPAAPGFADYLFGIEASYLLVEAKRAGKRFRLESPSKARKLKLDGPHLLSKAGMRGPLEQAQRYASDRGAQVAILTNGSQYVIFRPYQPGRSWTRGVAISFYDHDDILQDFALFYRLLARDHVLAGEILGAFEEFEGITETLHTPIQFVQDSDEELVRNPFWPKISKIMAPLLTDQPEDPDSQTEIIRHCYVSTRLSDQADQSLDRLLRDIPTKALSNAQVTDTDGSRGGLFARNIERDIKSHRPGTYVVTGGVGSGKTTFLRRFALVVAPAFLAHYCIWVHLDFLTIGNVPSGEIDAGIESFAYKAIRHTIEKSYPDKTPSDGEAIRALFAEPLERAKKTRLYDIPPESLEYKAAIGEIVDALFSLDREYVTALLHSLSQKGLRLVIVLDNTDQQGEEFQERVFLFAQKLSQEHRALSIVALREERFFAAFRRGIFDAYGDRRFHIGSPDLSRVLAARLGYGRKKLLADDRGTGGEAVADRADIDGLLRVVTKAATVKRAEIVRMLACVSNGDMRHALDMFREFLSSGNTNIRKILRIVGESGSYTIPFHEFAKSAILGSRRYFRSSRSHIVNVFKKSAARRASHITGLRILARLNRAEESASSHGEGFVRTSTLLQEYRSSFGLAEDFEEVAGEFIRRGLVEAEPPKVQEVAESRALRISAAGSYYLRYLVRSFSYIDLVWIDTPLADRATALKLAGVAEATDMQTRIDRVRAFLDYMSSEEKSELAEVARRAGPYREALLPEIQAEIEIEFKSISKKLKLASMGEDPQESSSGVAAAQPEH